MSGIRPFVISAPFGNYVQPSKATATLGTFTLYARPGRWRQVLRTVRYHRSLRSWTNQIGLRNPGIRSLAGKDVSDKIVSLHGFDEWEWGALALACNEFGIDPLAFELNVSCPNVTDSLVHYGRVFRAFPHAIVKLPPIRFEAIVDEALAAGITTFHACNTLPVPAGGISGQVLKPLALDVVRYLRRAAPQATIIGGGGISTEADVREFASAGADHFAIGSALLNPLFVMRGLHQLVTEPTEEAADAEQTLHGE